MLSFTLNSEPFALDRSASARLTWKNPACNLKDFPGDVGMGITIPVNDINRTLLGNPERFERYAKTNIREFTRFEIRYGGALLMGGTLVVQSASHEKYDCWLRSDVGNLGKTYQEKYISDSYEFYRTREFENKADYDPLTDHYGCPKIYNPNFFEEKGEKTEISVPVPNPNYGNWGRQGFLDWGKDKREYIYIDREVEDLTEAFRRTAAHVVNATNPDGTVKTPDSSSRAEAEKIATELEVAVVSPMLFLNYMLKAITKDAGFYIASSFLEEDENLKKLILYNNYDITQIILSPSLWGFLSYYREHDPWYDIAIGQAVETIRRRVMRSFKYKDLVPNISLKDFIMSVQNLCNVFLHFRPGRRLVDIIDREQILTAGAVDIEEYLTGHWLLGEEKNATLKFTFEHDDNDTWFSGRWTNMDDFRDNEKEAVQSWEDLPQPTQGFIFDPNNPPPEMDEVRYIKDKNIYVQYKMWVRETKDPETGDAIQKKFIGWSTLSMGFQNGYFNYGREEEEEITTKFSTLYHSGETITYQKGNIRSEVFPFESFTPRLLFYTGNNTGKYETDTLSIDWEKQETGLIENRWRWWARFWARRQPVECEAHFPLNVLTDTINNIYKKYRTREGEFIIEEMETEFGLNEISTTKIKGYKINYAPYVWKLTDMWKINDPIRYDEEIIIDLPWWKGKPESEGDRITPMV